MPETPSLAIAIAIAIAQSVLDSGQVFPGNVDSGLGTSRAQLSHQPCRSAGVHASSAGQICLFRSQSERHYFPSHSWTLGWRQAKEQPACISFSKCGTAIPAVDVQYQTCAMFRSWLQPIGQYHVIRWIPQSRVKLFDLSKPRA